MYGCVLSTVTSMFVCMFACLWPLIKNFNWTHLNVSRRLNIHVHFSSVESNSDRLLPECRGLKVKTTQVETHMPTYVSFTYCKLKPWQTLRQTAHRWYAQWLNWLQVRALQIRVWSLVHAWIAIVAPLTDSGQSQILLLFMFCVPCFRQEKKEEN